MLTMDDTETLPSLMLSAAMCEWQSMMPGITNWPPASITFASAGSRILVASGRMWPWSRSIGWLPTVRWRSLAFCVTMAVLTFQFWQEAWDHKWVSDTMWRARLWIPYASMPIGLGILTLQCIADLLSLATGREAPFGIRTERAK